MKIAIDCRMKHGVETVVRNIVPYIAAEADAVYTMGDPSRFAEWWPDGVRATTVDFNAPVYGMLEQLRFPLEKIRDCDLLHVPHFNIPVRPLPFPLVVTINDVAHLAGVLPISRSYTIMARLYYHHAAFRARHIITLSQFSRKEIIERLHVPPEKISVIPCGVDPLRFHPVDDGMVQQTLLRLQVRSPYLLVSGSVRPHKNIGRVLQAFAVLKNRFRIPHALVIVGEREGFRINSALPRLGDDVARDVIFTGFLPDDDLIALYSGCEVFLFASLYEGFGLPPLEAMACGAPVVVSHAASIPEVVGDAGVYFDPYSVDAIVDAVHSLILDPAKRKTAAAASRKRAGMFDWSLRAREYLALYRDIIAGDT